MHMADSDEAEETQFLYAVLDGAPGDMEPIRNLRVGHRAEPMPLRHGGYKPKNRLACAAQISINPGQRRNNISSIRTGHRVDEF
jgi:hypothetical protein